MNREDLEVLEKVLERIVSPIVKLQQEHHRTLYGDGSDGNQGLRVNVDRLKQDAVARKVWSLIFRTSLVGLVLKDVWAWFTGKVPTP